MTTVYDVPAEDLIDTVAKKLQKEDSIDLPEANKYSRTGVSKENIPTDKDWWYKRCASILRKVYINEGIGVQRLRAEYGGKQDRGSKAYKAKAGAGSIVRRALQQLEDAGYVKKIKGKGRVVTPKGRSFLDDISREIYEDLKENHPGLEKY
ncbi:MAG: 30S ribosomal protein S19e [Candidatus Thermoplasmatota archaeon]